MKLFIFALLYVSTSLAQAPRVDAIASGSISSSGAIATINVSRSTRYGVGIVSIVSGTVGSPTAQLQGSMDGANWFNVPIEATGDATKSASLSTSGTIYLTDYNLSYNWIRVFFGTVTGGGSLVIQQISRVWNPKQ